MASSQGRNVDVFRSAAKLAIVLMVPLTAFQLFWGNSFGIQTTNAQPMKIAASEALWDTEEPASFSIFQIGGFTKSDPTPSFSIEIPGLLSYLATGSFHGKVVGLNQNQAQDEAQFGPGNYVPMIEARVLVDAGDGVPRRTDAPARSLGRVASLAPGHRRRRNGSSGLPSAGSRCPFLACFAGWILTETGRQPWIVWGLQKTADAVSPTSTTSKLVFSLTVLVVLYAVLAVVDFWLMRHYARLDPPEPGAERRRRRAGHDAGAELLMQTTWFWILCGLWSLYFVTEGFDFGVGMLLPVLGRSRRTATRCSARSGRSGTATRSGWSIAGAATFAAFPIWYATMFSGFYIAFVLLLVLLIVRVVSFEWRGKAESTVGARHGPGSTRRAAVGIPLIWGIGLSSLLHGLPISSEQEFTGTFWDLFTPYTVVAGIAFVALFAFHGARLPDASHHRRPPCARRFAREELAVPAVLLGAAFLVWTLAVGIDKNDQDVFPGIVLVVVAALAAVAPPSSCTDSAKGSPSWRPPRRSCSPWSCCSPSSTRG